MSHFGILTSFDHNSHTWQAYKGRLTQWYIANDIDDVKDPTGSKRRAILLSALSEGTFQLTSDLALPKDLPSVPFDDIITLLDNHFVPKKCGFGERYKFYTATQNDGESYVDWAARLRGLTAYCGFLNVEEALRDHFVMAMLPGTEREKLFAQDPKDLTLARALEIAESIRSARAGARAAEAVKDSPRVEPMYKIGSKNPAGDKVLCSVCGFKNHKSDQCRFANYKCKKCNEKGHLRRMCKKINFMINESVDGSGDDGELYNIRTIRGEPMTEVVTVQGVQMKFQIDSGSAVTAISEQTYLKHFKNVSLSCTSKRLLTYNGIKIECIGIAKLSFSYTDKTYIINVHVIRHGGPPLLGRDFISLYKLGMSQINFCANSMNIPEQLQSQYPRVFSDVLGTFNKYKVKLNLKNDAKPIFFKPRPVAYALRNKIDNELDRLVRVGILKPIEYSEYASPIVPVLKRDGTIRLCVDYSVTVNKQLLVDQYPLPTAQELFTKLHGGQQFSKLDLSQAYAQCILDDESQKITCINTHKGLFNYTRLAFGLASAPAIFQRVMEGVLSDMEGVLCMLDDVLITGSNRSVHLNRLHAVLRRLQDAGLTLQKTKCEFFKDEVEYLGYIVDKNGLKKSPQKVNAILNAPIPKDVKKLQSFLGLVNYYRNFVPNASSILSPLYMLLQKKCNWYWDAEHENAFNTIKKLLVSDQVLAHFNTKANIILTVDASPSGLGAILSQVDVDGVERPVSFASRTLQAAERGYSQIQKEATAIIFGVRRFHQYLYGRSIPFILRTDHKPLITIFGSHRGIPEVSANRLQRYAMFLNGYNFKIEYIRSADNCADYLSRASIGCNESFDEKEYEGRNFIEDRASYVNFVVDDSLPIKVNELRQETNNDCDLATVSKYILKGWPRKILDENIRPYFLCKDQLSYENGIIMRGHKVVVPKQLRYKILCELHKSHLGIVKCKSEARSKVWFPGIDKAIEEMIGACNVCVQLRQSPARAPLAVWPHPPQPFYRVHIDFLGPINNHLYLVIVDAYSKWIEVKKVNNTSSNTVINNLYEFMSRFGLIHTLVSDNATCFLSKEFVQFCTANGISHVTSPAYHPASNGQAESYVKIAKRGIKSCLLANEYTLKKEHLLKYLFDYRNSVHVTTGFSPAELVFGRKLRSRLDMIVPNKPPQPIPSDTLIEIVKRNQSLQSKAYGGRNKHFFKKGDNVMYKKNHINKQYTWKRGIVMEKIGKTIYLVKDCESLIQVKKHQNQLIPYKGTDSKNVGLRSTPMIETDLWEPTMPSSTQTPNQEKNNEAYNSEEGAESEPSMPPAEELSPEGTEQPHSDEVVEAVAGSDNSPEPQPQIINTRAGQSGMVLRPLPRINYKI